MIPFFFITLVDLLQIYRGIGAGIAIELGKRGASVIVNHASVKSAAAGAEVVRAIEAHGSKASLIHADVASSEGIKKLIQAAVSLSEHRKIDILVHNAGHGDDAYLQDVTEDFYTMQTDINIKGELHQCDKTDLQSCKSLKANTFLLSKALYFLLKPRFHISHAAAVSSSYHLPVLEWGSPSRQYTQRRRLPMKPWPGYGQQNLGRNTVLPSTA